MESEQYSDSFRGIGILFPLPLRFVRTIKFGVGVEDKTMKEVTIDGVTYVEKGTELPVMSEKEAPYRVGENYYIRTVTMSYTGKLVWVGDKELVLENPAWIADSGRFMQALHDGVLDEVEPMNDTAIIGRGAIVDASIIKWEIPTQQK